MSPSATPATQSAAASRGVTGDPSASPEPAQSHKDHACHAKRRWMSPRATRATRATRNDGGCHQAPRLPRKVPRRQAASREIEAHHQSHSSPISTTPATQNEGGCRQAPRVPRETTADAAKRHTCHAKSRGVTRHHAVRRHGRSKRVTRASPVISTTPATRSDGGCRQAPHLPRETTADVAKCHACHNVCDKLCETVVCV